jgi:putative transcriptional regulator
LLKAARAAKGLTQAQLSEATGISKATIVSIEHGTRLPHARSMQKLCEVLGLDVPELVSRTELERGKPVGATVG